MASNSVSAVFEAIPEARAVGGCVRDHLAGVSIHDIDLAAPLSPQEVCDRLTSRGVRVVETGMAHGTVTAIVDHEGIEITSLRRDVATDGRRASVAWTQDWRVDAERRDFTINALSMSKTGDVWDYFGGLEDLKNHSVRFVGSARKRLAEDHLRALRYFRFFARFDSGRPDPDAVAAITDMSDGIKSLSVERLWSETKKILELGSPGQAVELMKRTGVLGAYLPEAVDGVGSRLDVLDKRGAPADPILRLASILPPVIDTGILAERLKMSRVERARLASLKTELPVMGALAADIRRELARNPEEFAGRCFLAELNGIIGDWAKILETFAATEVPVFPLLGKHLLEAGLPRGPQMGEILNDLRSWWLEGGCIATLDDCLEVAVERYGARCGPAHTYR
jgi:poly(A) polymerase/tRNA nucleotidyltransferase (CCA-adding enzyme)